MIRRTKSFSNYGTVLDKKLSLQPHTDNRKLNEILRKVVPIKLNQSSLRVPITMQGFDKNTSRQKLSPFQIFNTKDFARNANYQNKMDKVLAKNPQYTVKKQSDVRLSKLIPLISKDQQYTDLNKQPCKKCSIHNQDLGSKVSMRSQSQSQKRASSQQLNRENINTPNDQKHKMIKNLVAQYKSQKKELLTTKDLQNKRKQYHNIDFSKQTSRPATVRDQSHYNNVFQASQQNFYLNQHITEEAPIIKKSQSGFVGLLKQNSYRSNSSSYKPVKTQQKMRNTVHSFNSYTKRKYLSQEQLRAAPPTSGIEYYKVPVQKYKGKWKQVQAPKFDKMTDKYLNRYDRDSEYWYTKLQYEPGKAQEISNSTSKPKKNIIRFDQQTKRQDNQVKSKYPMRIAI